MKINFTTPTIINNQYNVKTQNICSNRCITNNKPVQSINNVAFKSSLGNYCRDIIDKANNVKKLREIGIEEPYIYSLSIMSDSGIEKIKKLLESEVPIESISMLDGSVIEGSESKDLIEAMTNLSEYIVGTLYYNNKLKSVVHSKEFQENKQLLRKIKNLEDPNNKIITAKEYFQNYLIGFKPKKINKLSLQDKYYLLSSLLRFQGEIDKNEITFSKEEREKLRIKQTIAQLQKSLFNAIQPTEISEEDAKSLFTGFLTNNNSEIETTLKTFDFKQYGKEGLPLKYSRKEYLKDLSNILSGVDNETIETIFDKLDITPLGKSKFYGYNGIIDLSKLNLNNPIEKEVYRISENFIKNNEVITGNKKADECLNSLIKGMPEFINIIGKSQHINHNYSVDIHTLKVLQTCMNDKRYEQLEDIDKLCLKISILFHDMAKSEGEIDKSHQYKSALYAKDIIKRYRLPKSFKTRVYEFVKNHHWNELYNTGQIHVEETAGALRRNNDFLMGQIMASADLYNVSDSIYTKYIKSLSKENMEPIIKALDNINESGQLIFTSKIINPNKLDTVVFDNKEFKVLYLNKIKEDEDLSEKGFPKGTKYNDLRFIAHMIDYNPHNESMQLQTTNDIVKDENEGYLSATLITPRYTKTYGKRTIGFSLDAENANIGMVDYQNLASGILKNEKNFLIDINKNSDRFPIPYEFKKSFNLSDEEYKDLFMKLSNYKYITQIKDDKFYKAGNKNISGKDIKDVITKANNNLAYYGNPNEITVFMPKIDGFISKVSIDKIPKIYLDYIYEKNLPIIMIK